MIPRKLAKTKKRIALPGEPVRIRCRPHLNWVRKHGCCVPGCDRRDIEVAHVRTGTDGAAGVTPSDIWTISLCHQHHIHDQHVIGEAAFERKYGIDMKALAREFVQKSPQRMKLMQMMLGHGNG